MKYLGLFLLVLGFVNAYAQADMSWGVKAGMNLSQHYGTQGYDLDFEVKTGVRWIYPLVFP
ncbi:MAG TPA: hypothetical protein PKI59_01460 [Candidatus Cloacimonadota bacterium]|nr:hypothetical protein [Candidatus Cloacimonadota bacterium]